MAMRGFPKLEAGQYAVIHCEGDTGIILLPDGRRRISDDSPVGSLESEVERWAARGDLCLVFNSLAEAKKYCSDKVNEVQGIECQIYDHQQNPIEQLWNHDYWETLLVNARKAQAERQKKWYKKILESWF